MCTKLLEEVGVDEAPVDLRLLGSMLGVSSIAEVDIPEAGKLIPKTDGNFAIFLNKADSQARKRFTTAHELGHLLVPGGVSGREIIDYEVGLFDKEKTIEFLCDVAAANLLMPTSLFDEFVKGKKFTLQTIVDISQKFNVSLEAAALQMVKRSPGKRAVVVWEHMHKPKEEVLLATPTFPGFEDCAPDKLLRVKYAFGLSRKEHIPKSKSLEESKNVILSAFEDQKKSIHKSRQVITFGPQLSIDCECEAIATIAGRVLSIIRR